MGYTTYIPFSIHEVFQIFIYFYCRLIGFEFIYLAGFTHEFFTESDADANVSYSD